MCLKGLFKISAIFLMLVAASGCGDGNSETNGNLTLSANAPTNAGVVNMSATALLTPTQTGSEVTFVTTMFNAGGALFVPADCSGKKNTVATGIATISCNIPQPTVAATLQISAVAGGLEAIPVSIPIEAAP